LKLFSIAATTLRFSSQAAESSIADSHQVVAATAKVGLPDDGPAPMPQLACNATVFSQPKISSIACASPD
jgi:hypothetical protein